MFVAAHICFDRQIARRGRSKESKCSMQGGLCPLSRKQMAITGIGFLIPASSQPCLPLQGSCLALTGHLQPPSAASPAPHHQQSQSCSLLLLPWGHPGIGDAFVTQLSTTRSLGCCRSRGASRLHLLCTQKGSSRAGRWHRLSCSVCDTPVHGRDGTGVCRWGFVDAISINHSLSQLNKCWIHHVSPGWRDTLAFTRKFPFLLVLGETIQWSIPSVFSHDPVRAQSSSRCPRATQPLSRCPASPVGPELLQGHLK